MRLIVTALAAVALAIAAPTKPSTVFSTFKTEVLDKIIEELCLDMSHALCTNANGHRGQYAVYDSESQDATCKCSNVPSQYIVSRGLYHNMADLTTCSWILVAATSNVHPTNHESASTSLLVSASVAARN
jgi:hypothetical protein